MEIDIAKVKALYESTNCVWPEDDLWHQYSRTQIIKYIKRIKFCSNSYILNAGSGGSDYGLMCRMLHLDIAKNKIDKFNEYKVSSVESMPFNAHIFTDIICVGSVINYCDAMATIQEFSRVLLPGGCLILEFESSWGYEHRKSESFMRDADVLPLSYFGEYHNQWVYSPKYISGILESTGFKIRDEFRFHYISGISFSKYKDENRASRYAKFDWLCRLLPRIKQYSSNVIYRCIMS